MFLYHINQYKAWNILNDNTNTGSVPEALVPILQDALGVGMFPFLSNKSIDFINLTSQSKIKLL